MLIVLLIVANTSFGQITITTQSELNALAGSSIIYDDLIITTVSGQDSSTMVTDLSPLMSTDSIFGNLEIKHTALTDLSGLSNLKYVKDFKIYENTVLKDLSTLDGPMVMEKLNVYYNSKLTVCSDFSFAKSLPSIRIYENQKLVNISIDMQDSNGLSIHFGPSKVLETIKLKTSSDNYLSIKLDENKKLYSFELEEPNDSLLSVFVRKNDSLVEFKGFKDVRYIDLAFFENNMNLSELCFIKQALQRQGIHTQYYSGNATGANSEVEVMATDCSDFNTGIIDLDYQELSIYPNPAHNEVFVEIPNQLTPYQIYDMSGKIIQQGSVEATGRIGLAAVSGGMYVLLVGDKRSKLVIQ